MRPIGSDMTRRSQPPEQGVQEPAGAPEAGSGHSAPVLSLEDARKRRLCPSVRLYALPVGTPGREAAGLVAYEQSDETFPAVMLREQKTGLVLTPTQARDLACALIEFAAQAELINDELG